MKRVIEGSMAIAEAVKLCKPVVIPMFPITPQTHVVEYLADFINNGELDAEMIHVESEHSAISAALGASGAGVRTFTATSSQGLALMHEVLFIASGLRLPVVMAVANRSLSAPINIWNDHQDTISERDSGWIQLYAESSQEAHDMIFQAYKIAEDREVMLPVMVCVDGFILTHLYEPLELADKRKVARFLPNYKPVFALDTANPCTIGPLVGPGDYIGFKKQQADAIIHAKKAITAANEDYSKIFKRSYGDGLIETHKMKDAKYAVVALGSICSTVRDVLDEGKIKDTGIIRIRSFRPFPADELREAAKGTKKLIVLDKSCSPGQESPLLTEVMAAVPDKLIRGFVIGLGGRDVTTTNIKEMIEETIKSNDTKTKWVT